MLHPRAIRPVQQYDYSRGKNASDMAMVVDAMALLYNDHPDAFGIVSSDADFTPLVMHLREKGAAVYGFGERKTPEPFRSACTKFLFLDQLAEPDEVRLDERRPPMEPAPSAGDAHANGRPRGLRATQGRATRATKTTRQGRGQGAPEDGGPSPARRTHAPSCRKDARPGAAAAQRGRARRRRRRLGQRGSTSATASRTSRRSTRATTGTRR